MGNSEGKVIFLDYLNFNSFIYLLRRGLSSEVLLLDKPTSFQIFFVRLLKLRGYNVSEAFFFAGHLNSENGQSVYLTSNEFARKIAVKAALEILETNKLLYQLNEYFGRNTLHLHLTKQLVWYIKFWSDRILVSKALANGRPYQVCLKLPDRLNPKVISDSFADTEILNYTPTWFSLFGHIKKPIALFLELIRLFLFPFNGKRNSAVQVKQNSDKPAVFLLQEDTIRADTSLRGQPHWFDFEKNESQYKTYILKSSIDNDVLSNETKTQFERNNIFVFETAALKEAFSCLRNHDSLKEIRALRKKLLISLFSSRGYKNTYFMIRTALFLKQAEFMGAISLWLNVKVFLFRESYIPFTDAIQIVSKKLNVKTIAYQYSNLGTFSPVMMNTADQMLVFSDQFKKLFANQFFTPASILETGYIYDGLPDKIKERALKSRKVLLSKGVEFIICFFDESVQHDKWGLISKADHLGELHSLAGAVLNDPTMGVVIKSQFLRNSPSQLYPADELISRAVSTGRFVELYIGSRRNDIFPAEAALISDITIGHKFGATASLEAAAEGVRSVMLDAYGTKMIWDEFYDREYITFLTMESLMEAIKQLRLKNDNYQNLGDWSSFLDQLIRRKDGKAIKRLREIVEKECLEIITDVDN
jgi:hypothetical protein